MKIFLLPCSVAFFYFLIHKQQGELDMIRLTVFSIFTLEVMM